MAVETLGLVAFTGTLWWSTKRLWEVTRDAGVLAREEFIASHRPRVIVRLIQGVYFHEEEAVPRPYVWVTIVNVGDTPATVTDFGGDLVRKDVGPGTHFSPPGLNGSPQPIEPVRLASGERRTFTVTATIGFTKQVFIRLVELRNNTDIFAIGAVRYRDENGVSRETGYWRQYSSPSERFSPSTNPDEEYQD